MHPKPITRRRFLKTSAFVATAPLVLPAFPYLRAAGTAANDRIQLGIIGMGRMGRTLLHGFLGEGGVQVVALCEVDSIRREDARNRAETHYAEAAGKDRYRGVHTSDDFRELLDREDIDAVVVATPDHWHALMGIAAARAGKDVYCEKPLCQTVEEAQALVEVVRRNDCVFQTGSQQRSSERFRRACEWVRNGRIGRVRRIHVALPPGIATWCDLPESDPPEGLDWDLWLGPAPERGWNEILSPVGVHNHFPDWRNFREYGGGMITDWGAHHFDIVQWALGTDDSGPVEVIPPSATDAETGTRLIYRDGVEVVHIDGNGITFFGTEGAIFVNRHNLEISPESLRDPASPADAIRLEVSDNHLRNWLDCIRSRREPICGVETGARSVTVCHLVNLAYWHRRAFAWDPAGNRFFGGGGDPAWLRTRYRPPWTLTEA